MFVRFMLEINFKYNNLFSFLQNLPHDKSYKTLRERITVHFVHIFGILFHSHIQQFQYRIWKLPKIDFWRKSICGICLNSCCIGGSRSLEGPIWLKATFTSHVKNFCYPRGLLFRSIVMSSLTCASIPMSVSPFLWLWGLIYLINFNLKYPLSSSSPVHIRSISEYIFLLICVTVK